MTRSAQLALVCMLSVLIAIPLFVYGFLRPQKATVPATEQQTVSVINTYPILPNDPSVTFMYINYSLSAFVKSIQTTPENADYLVLTTGKNLLPPLLLSSKTQIAFVENGKRRAASRADLKENTPVLVYTSFDVRKKTWTVHEIVIQGEDATQ